MPLTITINEAAPGTLTIGVGPPGVGVPAGGTAGQVLTKVNSTDYNTVFATPAADYITAVTAPLAVTSGNLSVDLSAYLPLAGGTMTGYLYNNPGTGFDSVLTEGNFKIKATSSPTDFIELTYNTLTVASPIAQTQIGPAGITFADTTQQITAGISSAAVAANYYPLSGNPSGFLAPDAPSDGTYYARLNGAWAVVVGDAPSDGTTYGRNNAAWVATAPTPGYTNSVWTGGTYASASVTNIYDTATQMYYNVLTF